MGYNTSKLFIKRYLGKGMKMSTYRFHPMTKEMATRISSWKYENLYSFYDMEENEDCISELMNGDYYYALNGQDLLVGFLCSGNSARVSGGYEVNLYSNNKTLDIGIGLRPDLTGRGEGQSYVTQCISFLQDQFKAQDYQLVVAKFNERAIKVYERTGFVKGISFKSKVNEQEVEFIAMKLEGGKLE